MLLPEATKVSGAVIVKQSCAQLGGRFRAVPFAAQYLGDPEQFWRIADANGVTAPETLTDEAGTIVRITLPADVPAMTEEQ